MAQEDEQDDAARAFEDLTAEVRVMRRAVEALEARKPTDYAPTLAAFAQKLEKLTLATVTMAERPAMRLTPDSYAAQMGRAADEAARHAVAELQRVQTLTGTLERTVGRVRTGEDQRRQVLRTGGGALAVGALLCVVLLPPIARALPASWHVPETLSASVVGENRWTAGQRMMTSYAPGAWENIARGAELAVGNRKALDACAKESERTGQARRCTIRVGPPTRPSPVPGGRRGTWGRSLTMAATIGRPRPSSPSNSSDPRRAVRCRCISHATRSFTNPPPAPVHSRHAAVRCAALVLLLTGPSATEG